MKSLLKKIRSRGRDCNKNNDVGDSKEGEMMEGSPESDRMQQTGEGRARSSVDEEVKEEDMSAIQREIDEMQGRLNAAYKKQMKYERKLNREQRTLLLLEGELQQTLRQIKLLHVHLGAVLTEQGNRYAELATVLQYDVSSFEKEVQGLEPALYRKYHQIKTARDAEALMETIRKKRPVLDKLERLAYRKYMDKKHGSSSVTGKKKSKKTSSKKNKHTTKDKKGAKNTLQKESDVPHAPPLGQFPALPPKKACRSGSPPIEEDGVELELYDCDEWYQRMMDGLLSVSEARRKGRIRQVLETTL